MPYKRPESVLVVIYTTALEVLLMQRCDVPTFWQSVTGSLREGETPLQTAQREVWEETGVQVQEENFHDCQHQNRFEIKPPWRSRYDPAVTHNIEHVFTLRLPTRPTIQLHPKEHRDYCWLPREQAAAKASSYTNREAILKWVSRIQESKA
jgi:dATP pyrophosphohydrolase